jgi:hypothetical protein
LATQGTGSKPSVLIQRASASLVVAVYTNESPTNDEWLHYLEIMRTLAPGYRMIIFSAGGGPTTMQRRDLELLTLGQDGAKERVAVVTLSRLARGIVTAISWFNREIRAFDPSHRDEATEFLKLTKAEGLAVLRLARSMAKELGVSEQLLLAE